jgi:hypothetical protein
VIVTPVESAVVYEHLRDPEVAQRWSEAVRGGPPQLSVRWLTCHEGSFDRPSAYAVVSGPDGRSDAVAMFHVRRPDDHHTKYRLATYLADHSRVALDAPSVVVVAPSSFVSGLYVRDGVPADRARAAVDALRRTVTAIAHGEGARTILLPHLAAPTYGWFEDAIRFPMGPSAYLDLRGARSFDDYLAGLPGRRRREVTRERRAFAAAGLRIRTSSALGPVERLVDRQLAHYLRYGLAADRVRIAGQFQALAEHYRDDLLLLEVVRGDDELGHVVAVRERDWVIPKLAAFRGRETFGYFEAGYYAVIDWALGDLGCNLIEYGGAAIDAKVRRGCTARVLGGAVLPVD